MLKSIMDWHQHDSTMMQHQHLKLEKVMVLSSDQVVVDLNKNEDEPSYDTSYEDEEGFGIEEDGVSLMD
jgi:cell division protein FtsI/penicillin-binding protein 2